MASTQTEQQHFDRSHSVAESNQHGKKEYENNSRIR